MFGFEKIVGKKIRLISSVSPKQEYNIVFMGGFRNNVLLVSLPSVTDGQLAWQVGRRFHLRFTCDNVIYNRQVMIARICSGPYLCLRLLSPEGRQHEEFARQTRLKFDKKGIKVFLQGDSERIPASMADISVSGARLISAVRLGQVNETFHINLFTVGGANNICLPCKIRYVRSEIDTAVEGNTRFHHGVEFLHLTPSVEGFLLRLTG